ncbi:MAG TPA: ABC transporter substrate-binding protein [Galbitalea sp.]|jgi:peptide/nickel transport system substrate-binding protein|nr:ABC transporter substrate-binding protein [Galbitalea sp.]
MSSTSKFAKRALVTVAAAAAVSLALVGCAGGGGSGGGSNKAIIVGTTDVVTFLDPAGSYDNGSFAVMNQVYPFLFNSKDGTGDVSPDIAVSGTFTTPKTFTVKLKKGLKFANGHALTSSDVKFTFDRMQKINDPNGPASLLGNLKSTSDPNPTTVVFHLINGDDQTFEQVLSSPAGPIVDEQVFSPDKVTPDKTIVKGEAFAGQYKITKYDFNQLVQFTANPNYKGLLGAAKTKNVDLKYYTSSSNMKLDVQQGNIDVAARAFSATDVASLKTDKKVKVVTGPGGEERYIVFNFNTMPYGAKTSTPSTAKSLAVRQAAADLVDRAAIAKQVYKNTYTPLYSFVPQGLTGAISPLKSMYGDGNGGPSLDKAKAVLAAAGVPMPVKLSLQYVADGHYGPSSADEYALIKSQLEQGGVFSINLQSTDYVQYSKDRVADVYPAYQLGWFPDYSDADNYLTPFFSTNNFLSNHYSDPAVQDLITKQVSETDKAARTQEIQDIQTKEAGDLSTLPLLQGAQVVVTGTDISGAVLDPSFKFRFGSLVKN